MGRGCLTGNGKTVNEAKADLNNQIDAALKDSYNPAIVTSGDYSAVVWREPDGWTYRVFPIDQIVQEGIFSPESCRRLGNISRSDAIQQVAGHIVSIDGVDYHKDEELPAWLTDKKARSNVLYLCRFNRAYQWAKANKPEGRDNDRQWHEWACNHVHEDQFA